MTPTGVVNAKAKLSEIECVFRTNSIEKCCPSFTTCLGSTDCKLVLSATPASSILPFNIDMAKGGP